MTLTLDKLTEIKDRVSNAIFSINSAALGITFGHYVGVGIGYRRRNGQRTAELCVRVYVLRKLSTALVPPSHLLSGLLFGIPVDVAEVRRFVAYATATPALQPASAQVGAAVRIDPPFQQTGAGTLGAVVTDDSGSRYALSANHAIARNGLPAQRQIVDIGDGGFSPADPRSFIVSQPQLIGSEVTFSSLQNGCRVDCAMVKAAAGVTLTQRFPPEIAPIQLGLARPVSGAPAAKFGHSSHTTKGKVADHPADIFLDCGPVLGIIRVSSAILIEDVAPVPGGLDFAHPGDSGAMVFQSDGAAWSPLGLLMGGPVQPASGTDASENYAAVCPLGPALASLNKPGLRLADIE